MRGLPRQGPGSTAESDRDLAALGDDELAAVVEVVKALVRRDRAILESSGAFDQGADPYMYTDDYYGTRGVHLVTPPGRPSDWLGGVIRSEKRPGWAAVLVEMYDRHEGPTDLVLELDLDRDGNEVRVTFGDLHVM